MYWICTESIIEDAPLIARNTPDKGLQASLQKQEIEQETGFYNYTIRKGFIIDREYRKCDFARRTSLVLRPHRYTHLF